MSNEYEIIKHAQLKYINLIVVQLNYRTPHVHSELEFGMVLEGYLTIHQGTSTHHFHAGDMFILNPMETHELFSDIDGALVLAVQISQKLLQSYIPTAKAHLFSSTAVRKHIPESQYPALSSLLLEFAYCYTTKPENYGFICRAVINMILYNFYRYLPGSDLSEESYQSMILKNKRINRILEYIQNHYQEKLLLSDIAENEKLSLTYLSHLFKDTLHMTFQNYVNELRFEYALYLLDTTNKKILDICLESGFSDVRYLNKLFQSHYDCSPKDYRNYRIQTASTISSLSSTDDSRQKYLSQMEIIHIIEARRSQVADVLQDTSLYQFFHDVYEDSKS